MRPVFAYHFPSNSMLSEEEISLVLSDLFEVHHYDFNYYSRESLSRRINKIYRLEKFSAFSQFRLKIKSDPDYIEAFINKITVSVTDMFRDPQFFKGLCQQVFPYLSQLPQIRVWHAGCSSGEEIYSLAILLHEAGLLHKTRLLGTDINNMALDKAREAQYATNLMQRYARNYQQAGGRQLFSDYFSEGRKGMVIKPFIREKVFLKQHNLASDLFIGKFHLILCRNVLIYFDRPLRNHVFDLFDTSLAPGAFIGLGEKETLRSSLLYPRCEQTSKEKIWKKIK